MRAIPGTGVFEQNREHFFRALLLVNSHYFGRNLFFHLGKTPRYLLLNFRFARLELGVSLTAFAELLQCGRGFLFKRFVLLGYRFDFLRKAGCLLFERSKLV